ncbi:MAG: helicase [Candidatus Thioglobus sp.]|nr:MAG: helicase [Candidatus Thioglobus sp.]
MSTRFFTNQDKNTLFNKFEGVFKHNNSVNNFDVLVGYFRSSGYFKLRSFLENVDNIRILVGIDVDKLTQESHSLGLIYKEDAENINTTWQEKFIEDIQQANYGEQTEQGVKQFIADMLTGKVTIKAHPSQKIHAKIYIFRPDNFNEHTASSVITGSSNLTDAGLGTQEIANYEFNVLLNDYEEVQFATNEFEKLWQESIEILPIVAENSLKHTHLADDITPYELYLKCLIEYFGDEIEFDPNSIENLHGFKRLSYQLDAVNEGWKMLKKHNGFFLADVVGLGKTMIATLIAKQFLFLGGRDYNPNILLIVPPALKQNWEDALVKFEIRGKVKIFTNGSLHKITSPKDYDMVIVDEAHKFRNDTAQTYDELQRICKTKNKDNQAKKVILISATPLNNRPDDLYNQILLFQDGNNSTLDFPLTAFFTQVKKEYKEILKLANQKKAREQTAGLYEKIRERVIMPLMVRRTRTDLEENKRYKKDLDKHGVIFPKTTPPKPIYYKLEQKLERLYDETIIKIDNKKQDETGLLHTRYRALHYLKPEFKQKYIRADFIAERLVAIMKTLLLKRMDSSFYAFKETLNRFIQSSEIMLKMIDNNKIIIAPNINISDYILNDKEEQLAELLFNESLTIDPNINIRSCDDMEAGFVAGVKHDYKMLQELKSDWDKITNDPKIDEFLKQLPDFLAKDKNPEQKIIIFTESIDTMNYLTEQIKNTDYADKMLSINAKNRNTNKQIISENFDANINSNDKKNNYQIILTTDVLAEGVNLHRANTVINYDTPWNATKLMQRIGRVNRIGQMASHIFVYNFYPTEQINDDIGLEKKALIKLQAFHSALGEDSQIYSTEEQTGTFGIFDGNIQKEKNEIIPFLEEIRDFREASPEDYKRIKNMPSKVRCGVKNQQHQNGTLVFVRTENKGSSRFYKVSSNNEIENYGFIKTARLLKCSIDTKAEKLHEQHYSQVLSTLKEFETEKKQNIIDQTQNKSLSTADKKAINYLKAFGKLPDANTEEKDKLKQAIQQIENKRFPPLVKKINKLNKNSKGIKPLAILENILNIIKEYDVNGHIEDELIQENTGIQTKPSIVISQSYV